MLSFSQVPAGPGDAGGRRPRGRAVGQGGAGEPAAAGRKASKGGRRLQLIGNLLGAFQEALGNRQDAWLHKEAGVPSWWEACSDTFAGPSTGSQVCCASQHHALSTGIPCAMGHKSAQAHLGNEQCFDRDYHAAAWLCNLANILKHLSMPAGCKPAGCNTWFGCK